MPSIDCLLHFTPRSLHRIPSHTERIGDRAPKELRRGIKTFVTWSSTAIQIADRDERYAASVQTTTTEKQETTILSNMGYLTYGYAAHLCTRPP